MLLQPAHKIRHLGACRNPRRDGCQLGERFAGFGDHHALTLLNPPRHGGERISKISDGGRFHGGTIMHHRQDYQTAFPRGTATILENASNSASPSPSPRNHSRQNPPPFACSHTVGTPKAAAFCSRRPLGHIRRRSTCAQARNFSLGPCHFPCYPHHVQARIREKQDV